MNNIISSNGLPTLNIPSPLSDPIIINPDSSSNICDGKLLPPDGIEHPMSYYAPCPQQNNILFECEDGTSDYNFGLCLITLILIIVINYRYRTLFGRTPKIWVTICFVTCVVREIDIFINKNEACNKKTNYDPQ